MLHSFRKSDRVVKSSDFERIIRKGSCAADGALVVFAAAGADQSSTRLGVTIPKRTGNAVVRNRWKRLIRESFRIHKRELPAGYDFIVRPKKGATPSWEEIQKSIPKLTRKAIQRLSATSPKSLRT